MKITITPSMENYLESIFELGKEGQVVRVKDVADKMSVKMSSVTGALQNLAKNNLVHYTPYQSIILTENGEELARRVHNRHRVLTSFLIDVLGVKYDIAEIDACKLEHVLSKETMDGLLKFMVKNNYISISEKDIIDCSEEKKEG
jgi:DtxR family transcriptional regulator, Mn-dependent transcriptional regulator